MPAFKNVDKDEDGVISLQESKSSGNTTLKNFFAQLDSNKDSEVTTSEFERLKDLVKAANAKKRTMRAAEKKKKGKKGKKGKKRNKR